MDQDNKPMSLASDYWMMIKSSTVC